MGRESGEGALSTDEMEAVATSVLEFRDSRLEPGGDEEVGFDWQPVADLLAEVERLRAGAVA